ncbi:MAG: glycosyltransferase [Gemmatimonadaceae bacterium]
MKVLHVAPSIAQSYGGPTSSLAGYVAAARLAGIDVTVTAPRCAPEDIEAFVSRAGKTELHLFRSVGGGGFAVSPTLVRWVNGAAKSFDVVHVHGLFNSISSLSARAASDAAAVVLRPFGTLSRYTFRHRRTALKRAYFALLEKRNLRAAAALHFTSDAERSEADWHGVDFTGRAYVIPPPSLVEKPREVTHDNDDNASSVLFLGRIDPIKNLESLLDAWLLVRRANPSVILELAGEGDPDYVATLQRRANMNGVGSSVVFRGFASAEKKERLWRSAAVLVLPSHHENFGVVVLEALEAGIPVVVSPDVHLAEFVKSEGVGKVAVANPPILADAILSVLGDDAMRNHARNFGPSIVERNFSPLAIGKLLSEMYGAAVARRRALTVT